MAPPNPRKEYISNRVTSASPMELTRMLYEGALQAVQEAVTAHRAGDILGRGNAVTRAVEILGELRFSLRRDVAPQYCDTLAGLYGYLQRRLIQAHAEKSENMLQEVGRLIQTLLEGWVGAMDNLAAALAAGEDREAAQEAAPAAPTAPAAEPVAALSDANPYSSKPGAEPQNRSWQF
jgi:flagellar secretion chaperone FliS